MSILLLEPGPACTLSWVAGASGKFRAKEYFDSLNDSDRAKFHVLFERMARDGVIKNEQLFRKESDDIYCFKRGQHRLACFREGRDMMLVYGFRKKTNKDTRLRRDIEKAERIRAEYIDPQSKD
jgi:hypothetical protein